MAQQLSFDLPAKTALGRNDFFVSPANAEAVGMIDTWQNWPARKLILIGPNGAGKTHLTHVWAAQSGAKIVPSSALVTADIPNLASHHLVVEDCAEIAGNADAEAALFHLHNLAFAEGNSLLLTADRAPKFWQLELPDLISRMQALTTATLREPDDALLAAVIMKLMSDRQLAPTPDTIPYLSRRIDRSFDAARQIVDHLDKASMAAQRPINRALAGQVLDKLAK